MKKQKKSFKLWLKESALNKNEFYVKMSFTIFFAVIFILCFFAFDGYRFLFSTVYANNLKGYHFQIHTIDVEHGDCFLIKLPDEKCMLIDTGKEKYADQVSEYIKQFFIDEHINKIDYLVLTHPDSDHIGGAEILIKEFEISTLLRPPIYSVSEDKENSSLDVDESVIYDGVITAASQKGVDIQFFEQGLTLYFGTCKVEFLSPKLQKYSSSNNYSAVMMFSQQTKKFLFMGDAEKEIEDALISEYKSELKADVLKVGHHGSSSSTSQNFLNYVQPTSAIISCGNTSKYFPSNAVEDKLLAAGVNMFSTASVGSFVTGIVNDNIVCLPAERGTNYLAIIFSVVFTIVLIVWENPFKNAKATFLRKKI